MVTLDDLPHMNTVFEKAFSNGVDVADGARPSSASTDSTPSGMKCDIKNLYQGPEDRRGRFTWIDKYPTDLEDPAENAESARYALLVRNRKCFDGRKKLELDSLVVQSPLLKEVLGVVLKDYPGVTTGLDRLTFSAPFQPFVHRWERLVQAKEEATDVQTKRHVDLLHDTLEAELSDTIKAKKDLVSHNVITFDYVWTIFEPADFLYTSIDNTDRSVQLESASYQMTRHGKAFVLDCEEVDWDGDNFGRARKTLNIFEFSGTMPISQLGVYPLNYHANESAIRAQLVQRGKVFERLHGYHYKAYKGIAFGHGCFGPIKYTVSQINALMWSKLMC